MLRCLQGSTNIYTSILKTKTHTSNKLIDDDSSSIKALRTHFILETLTLLDVFFIRGTKNKENSESVCVPTPV